MRRHDCANARTARVEALFFFTEFVKDASVSVVHVYFPDPWPKARHNKRRLIQEPFLKQVQRVLVPGGRLQVVTDHKDYFEQIDRVVRASTLNVVEYNKPGSAAEGEFVGTNFERKYRREGRPFYAIAAVNSPTCRVCENATGGSREVAETDAEKSIKFFLSAFVSASIHLRGYI